MDTIAPIKYLIKNTDLSNIEWNEGVFIPVEKPFDWTSFDVVNKIRYQLRRITGIKKIKVGHAGTLDPRATGLLIIGCGRATKSIERIVKDQKTYCGVIQLGGTTPTYDGEMEVDKTFHTEHITDEMIANAVQEFTGQLQQLPPIFSAIKKDGKPLYKSARKGQEVAVLPRPIEIFSLHLERMNHDQLAFHCRCSKGTYIRSIAHDFGEELGVGAYLTQLRRTAIGSYFVDDAWIIEDFEHYIKTLGHAGL